MVSIHKLAQDLGVSPSTVSLALRGDARVRSDTRIKITEYAEQVGYVPSFSARSLSKGQSFTLQLLGTVSPQQNYDPFLFEFFRGVTPTVEQAGYRLTFSLRQEASDIEDHGALKDRSVDGFILLNPLQDEDHTVFSRHGLPVVVVGSGSHPGIVTVDTDNISVGTDIARHLRNSGVRYPYLLGPEQTTFTQERLAGMRTILDVVYLPCAGHPGHALEASLLALGGGADAIIVTDDVMLPGVLKAQAQMRRTVAITGMGNTLSAFLNPECTSVDFNAVELGHVAASTLLGMVTGEPPPAGPIHVPHTLHLRESTRL